ncbi:cytochrome P450 [Aeoliella sp. SH292]|uniref:cytochrome P450 n=1 Tax=Aeoliella sp. SH292 TaxID=3454464 RepID=UPI003F9ADA4E
MPVQLVTPSDNSPEPEIDPPRPPHPGPPQPGEPPGTPDPMIDPPPSNPVVPPPAPVEPRDQLKVPVLADSSLSVISNPYGFIGETCRKHQTPLFETRLLLSKSVCMLGADAAQMFYDETRITRKGATPGRVQKVLFGKGGVQGLDDAAHKHRKAMFVELLSPTEVERLVAACERIWPAYRERCKTTERVVLYDEVCELLCQAACDWAAVPLKADEVQQRTRELVAMFQFAGSMGPKYWWARWMRNRGNAWIKGIIRQIRAGELQVPHNSPAYVVAQHRDLNGKLLCEHDAAIELINLLRPIVAIAVFIVFTAHALHEHPECRDRVANNDEYREWFVQEVRRLYPFFPFTSGIVRKNFTWRGYEFKEGRRVLLDLYGTNRDPSIWDNAEAFRPERFASGDNSPFGFIPQGGGDARVTHRCPGEGATIEIMKWAVANLVKDLNYRVPPQDLKLEMTKLPALPQDRFVIECRSS